MVLADNYLMLLETDPVCNKSQQRNNFLRTVVDDVILHEQLLLTWPYPPGKTAKSNLDQFDRLYLRACSGLLIRPSGRFVERSLPEGIVSFWLLRAVVTLRCPKFAIAPEAYYVHLDQWIETSSLGVAAEPVGSFSAQNDQDSMRPIIYSPQPDKSVRIDCTRAKNALATYHLTGYVRRVRLFWSLSGTLLPSQSDSSNSPQTATPGSGHLKNTLGDTTLLNATDNTSTWMDTAVSQQPLYQLAHPDFGIQIRLTSRMLFQGNFSLERKRALCEFFSGFWCPSFRPNQTDGVMHTDDLEACVQASMRCDKLPDCDPITFVNQENTLSADELNCDITPFNYSTERQERFGNSSQTDRWTSKLPWIVLAPVPLVLVCALVRICSQKRHLDLAEEGDLNRWRDPSSESNVPVLPDGGSAGVSSNKRAKLVKSFWIGKRQRRAPLYGPIRTLSSVPEVDEREVELHSSLSIPQGTAWTHLDMEQGDMMEINSNNPEQATTLGSGKQLSPNGMHSPRPKGRLAKSQSLTPLQEIGGASLFSTFVTDGIENRRKLRRPHITSDGPETVERRRTFLCWSTLINPDSSSSSSSRSSGSSSSSCSNCRTIDRPVVLRSRSCNDLTRTWFPVLAESVELQTFSTTESPITKDDIERCVHERTTVDVCPQDETPIPVGWSYTNLHDPDDRKLLYNSNPMLAELKDNATSSGSSEGAHAITVVAQLSNIPMFSEHQYDDSIKPAGEHSREQCNAETDQELKEPEIEMDYSAESHHADPLDTRSGSRDRLLLLHRTQSPPRSSD